MYIYKDICINKIKACINSNDFYVIIAYIIRNNLFVFPCTLHIHDWQSSHEN